jgi:hypothetical protein
MQVKRPEVAIGILIATVVVLVTLILQLENVVNVLANISEIYLFGVMLPALSFAFALMYKGFNKKELSGSTNPLMITVEQKSIENLRPLSEGEIFESELLPRQKTFHRGDPVLFHIRMKGKLSHGYLAAYIKKPDGTFGVVFDLLATVNTRTGKGKLNGEVNVDHRWSWTIPTDGKIGPYGFFIHAGNHFPPSLWVRIKALGLRIIGPRRTDLANGSNQAVFGNWEKVEVVE